MSTNQRESDGVASPPLRDSPNDTVQAMRFHWFVPFLRKKKKTETLAPLPIVVRGAQQVLPTSWFDDRLKGRAGRIRRTLRWLGPTVGTSPVRRLSQAVCLILFLLLFFWTLWPYNARPDNGGWRSGPWQFAEARNNGLMVWTAERSGQRLPENAAQVHVVDTAADDPADGYLGAFEVVSSGVPPLVLRPAEPLEAEALDRLLISSGPWSMRQHPPGRWPSHYADNLAGKEMLPAELFLVIDPLVSLSTAIASRSWVWSLICAAILLAVCVWIPRGFCGYLCPLGTLIDLFDWAVTSRTRRFRVPDDGWWVHVKYYVLFATLVSALFGVLVSGYVAAIPVVTRGMLLLGDPVQTAAMRGVHQIPPVHAGHFLSLALFLAVLMLGFLRPRFWCKYVCPSGAVFSLGNLFRATERKVESSCIHCNKCVEICPFDAIKPDFTTRTTDCTFCQTCGGACPVHAIKFVERWNRVELKVENDPPTGETAIGRRGFLSLAAGTTAAVAGGAAVSGATKAGGANLDDAGAFRPVRPPGSVPEPEFLEMCIRCGECFKACPNHVLQVEGFQQGLEGLWTPMVNADWAGCESSCNACGQVCPTGAIRALPLEEKKVARMGLAVLNESTCLPLAGRQACQLCVDECNAAGYEAIEFQQVHTEVDSLGQPVEGSGFLAPMVVDDKCVGCGLCQTRCYGINVSQEHLLSASAIVVEAGPGKEDRMMTGSYRQLRQREAAERKRARADEAPAEFFVPDAAQSGPVENAAPEESGGPKSFGADPFGTGAGEAETSVPRAGKAEEDPFGLGP